MHSYGEYNRTVLGEVRVRRDREPHEYQPQDNSATASKEERQGHEAKKRSAGEAEESNVTGTREEI